MILERPEILGIAENLDRSALIAVFACCLKTRDIVALFPEQLLISTHLQVLDCEKHKIKELLHCWTDHHWIVLRPIVLS